MMKRLYSLIFGLTLTLSLLANGVEIDGIYYLLDSANYTAAVTYTGETYYSNNAYAGDITIPATTTHNGHQYNVTSIGDHAFYKCSSLTSVTIPNSVTSIGYSAFEDCSGLTSIEIPNSVTSIEHATFFYCNSLTSVTIGNSVTSIGNQAFDGCSALTSIVVESGNSVYDSRNDCNAIIEATTNTLIMGCKNTIIPNSVTRIGEYAFHSCSGLTSIEIPNSVIDIGATAFNGCSGLTSIIVSTNNMHYCSVDGVLFNKEQTNIIHYPRGYHIAEYVIPNSVTSIGSWAFSSCTDLTSVTIPNSVTSIGDWAFADCSGLTSIEIPNSVTSIGNCAFADCSGLTSVTIPNSVTSIGYSAFEDCSGLTSIEIPNSVASIGYNAFHFCSRLKQVFFQGNSIDTISRSAFSYCSNLESVVIPDGIKVIDEYAFNMCTNLKTLHVGKDVDSIGEAALYDCMSLDSVFFHPLVPPTIDNIAFYGISSIATLFVPFESLDAYKAIPEYVSQFYAIEGFSFVEDITEESAVLKWIHEPEVTQYTIDIYQGTNHFAEYIVGGDGHVISSQRFAPSIFHQKMDTTSSSTDYFVLTIKDLSSSTEYTYEITGTNAAEESIYHEQGAFVTTGTEALPPVEADYSERKTRKVLRDGQLYIMYNGKMYNVHGQETCPSNL